jgi:hypothetical protein
MLMCPKFDIDDNAAVGGTLSCGLVGCFGRRDIEVPLIEARSDLPGFCQPRCLAQDVTVMLYPTRPAPCMRTFWWACTVARSTSPSQAVMKASGMAAASRIPKPLGILARSAASTAANSAREPCKPATPPVKP